MSNLPDLHPALSEALAAKGYAALTPVQEAVIAPDLAGQDLLVSAQTGSGKTVAFGLAMAAELLGEGPALYADVPRALVIAPTRELALQVRREFEWLYGGAGLVIAGAVGGMDARFERRTLERGAHIVVGTPGRICDHIRRGALDLSELRVAVLDEADEMLDLGFREDLEFILESANEERRTLMFSATVSPEIERLARTFQKDAQRVSTMAKREQHADIEYRALLVDKSDRENAIVNVLRFYEAKTAIVFCGTRATVTHLTTRFLNRGFSVVALSGELSQDERSRALQMMRDGRARVCIATDVAARGIDLPGLELVVHADLPINKEALLHRSGRTGRAGSKGVSAVIVPHNLRAKADRVFKTANIAPTWAAAPSAEEIIAKDRQRILEEPELQQPVTEDEEATVAALLERFEPRALAAAVARHFMASRSAPEDIVPVTVDGIKPRERAEFGNAQWLRLTMGHDAHVDPKWLLPMLCRAGDLTRRDIGQIRIMQDHSFVQIHADAAPRFLKALGPAMQLEDKCKVVTLDEAPEGLDRPPPRPARWDKNKGDRGDFKPGGKPFKKPHRKGASPRDAEAGAGGKPWEKKDKPAGKPWEKKDRPAGKPWEQKDKPASKAGAKPWEKKDKADGKPSGKPGAKPKAKYDRGPAKPGKKPGRAK